MQTISICQPTICKHLTHFQVLVPNKTSQVFSIMKWESCIDTYIPIGLMSYSCIFNIMIIYTKTTHFYILTCKGAEGDARNFELTADFVFL